jgi:hypothetical protein
VDRPELLDPGPGAAVLPGPAAPLPRLTPPEAVRALDRLEAAFLAFTTIGSGPAAVLYRRFDGGLGLITSLW